MAKKKIKIAGNKELKKQLKECAEIKQEYLAGWQRAKADFLNYKKQEIERLEKLLQYAGESFIIEMLPILDNLETAKKNLPEKLKKDENIIGLLQIEKQIKSFLKEKGLEEIKCLDRKFNPEFHEVVEQVKVSNKEPGIIVEEIKKGYKLHNKIIRPSRVKISN